MRKFWDGLNWQQRAALSAVAVLVVGAFCCGNCSGASILSGLAVIFG